MNNQNLMTPSASPAPFHRLQDRPSPTKRPRLASSSTPSTSSTSFVSTPPAFANQTYHTVTANTDGTDLHDARRASSFRVLNVWSQLAERYSRPLAEDDIVDLRTGDLVKDRNVIRSTPHQYDIGFFGDLDGTETATTDEGSDDELDAFAPGANISDELEMERVSREGLDPVREMDPADAQDLREFLEAESRRREEFGSEGEESLGREGMEGENGDDDSNLDQTSDLDSDPNSDSKEDDSTYIVRVKDSNDADSSSDDELNIWDDHDEGSMVHSINLDPDNLNDGEGVIDLPISGTPPPVPRKRSKPRKSSRSLPPVARSRSKSKRNMSPPIVQLHTPPQSSSSVTGTPSKKLAPKSAKSTPRSNSKAKQMTPSPLKRPRWEPEVVIIRAASTSPNIIRSPAKEISTPTSESEQHRLVTPLPNPKTPSRGRGPKRKRVISSSLEAGDYAEESGDPGMELPVISPDIDLIDFSKRNYDSYGRGSPVPVSRSSSRPRSNRRKSRERASSSKLVDPNPVSVPPMQGLQAQYLLAQAMHHLSYLMTASGHAAHPHPNTGHPSWPQSVSAYSTPVHHPHPYPYAFTPSLSNATLPPSSPDRATSSSVHTSPDDVEITRSQSFVRGRSKSRGRRVSFRIDDDRPHGLNERERGQGYALPLRFEEDHEDDADELGLSSSPNRDRSTITRRESSSRSGIRRSPTPRNKGNAKPTLFMDASWDESEPDESPTRARSKQQVGRLYERGQTPGPPSITPTSRSRSILRRKSNTPGI